MSTDTAPDPYDWGANPEALSDWGVASDPFDVPWSSQWADWGVE